MTRIPNLTEEASPANDDLLLLAKASDGAWRKVKVTNLGGGGGGTVDVVSNVATSRILGRVSAGSGDSEELTAAQVQSLLNIGDGSKSLIWAEENAGLNTSTNSGYQFAFGNGANGADLAIPYAGAIIALGITASAATTGTVELYVNGAATGQTVSLSAETHNTAAISQSIDAGDRVRFRTTSGSGGSVIVVSAVIQSSQSALLDPQFSFCQVRNTSTANINTSAADIAFGGTVDASDADYTLAADSVTVNFDGVVNVQAHISQSGSVARTNVGIWITKNNTRVSGIGRSGYIRAADDHDKSSSHVSATFAVSDGDVIRIRGGQQAAAGTVNQVAGQSQVTVERRA